MKLTFVVVNTFTAAIQSENYELAAELRDKISNL